MFYIIWNKKTEKYLPSPMHRGWRLHEAVIHQELSDTRPPRIFDSKKSAASVLGVWLKGPQTRFSGVYESGVRIVPDPDAASYEPRIREDMEIREVRVSICNSDIELIGPAKGLKY